MSGEPSSLLVAARVLPGREVAYKQWQAQWQSAVLAAGARAVEFLPAAPPDQLETVGLARFPSMDVLRRWRHGEQNRTLVAAAAPLADGGLVMQLVGQAAVDYSVAHGVTMVMVTEIKPGREAAYKDWTDRIQKLQATFPGYIGSFVQPPQKSDAGWTTVLRFDSTAHLDRWLTSPARAAMVKESEDLVAHFHAQRVDTSFPGWVPNDPKTGAPPSMWKTACLVLLTLFPVVMLELRFLNPHLTDLNPAVATFIGNIISVGLTTWPLMPLAIYVFRDWLFPEGKAPWLAWALPIGLVLCYLAEIALFWHLLS
jgi:antibiotic biosynthesis monooxygenase (ABM) superfamily enzyme